MKKCYISILVFVFLFFGFSNSHAQVSSKYSENLIDYKEVSIDVDRLKNKLENVELRGTVSQNRNSKNVIELPMPTGNIQRFRVVESPILSPELSASRPDVKSYTASGIDDPTATVRFNITSAGFYAVTKSVAGISIIEKLDRQSNDNRYITYYDHNIIQHTNEFICESDEEELQSRSYLPIANRADSCFQIGDNLRSYEMVLTCSGEFYALNGGTDPLVESALLARITQVNTVYEVEAAITFTIVEFLLNNDPATDPYSDPTNTFTSINETNTYINNNVTASSWDLGHGFHEITCGGGCGWAGRAGLGVVCTPSKANGYTYLPNDIPSAITVLLHEFGHQFSNRHTNYGCNSNNACSRYEPGQGSTIMSTGAGCDAGDAFASRTDYFSVASLQNMIDFMNTGALVTGTSCGTVTVGGWSDCATLIPTGNNMPSSNANANNINGLVIPHSTPFELSGSGSDADGTSSLTYNWEQYDTDYSGSDAPDDTGSSTTAPLFRSFPPSTSSDRTVPTLSSVLAGNVTTGTGEVLPTVARNLTWRLTVRDNEAGGGGVACDQISLTVGSDGPFRISSQNSTTAWMAGDTETVTWDVANTDNSAYTCANVDILYSSDGGATFSTTLASGVPNNGSTTITAPGLNTSTGRLKIVCTGGSNIFFDINDVDILVTSTCDANGGTIVDNTTVNATEGDASLNLGLMAGLPVNSVSGVLDDNDSNTNLTVENNGGGTCVSFGNNPYYETIELAASSNSSVTFTNVFESYFNVTGLFLGSYNPSSVCDNWLNSNSNFDSGTGLINIGDSFVETLTAGTKYVLLTSGFNTNSPNPGNYNVNFSETLYNVSALDITGYLYTYVIVNNSSGNIVAFNADSDLSNASNFPAGNYTVYGLSYLAGEATGSYIGNAFSSFQADITNTSFCGALSSNNVLVNISGITPVTYTYNTGTWSPIDPVGVSTNNDIIIVQTGNYTMSSNLECDTFTINPGASVTINSGITLTAASALNLESTSSLFSSLISDGTITGTINYNRYVSMIGSTSTQGGNDLISIPLLPTTGINFEELTLLGSPANNTKIAMNPAQTLFAFGPYDNTSNLQFVNYLTYNGNNPPSPTDAPSMVKGKGYRAATGIGETLTFSGAVESSTVNIEVNTPSGGSQWNLIGNPYPSYIDASSFINNTVNNSILDGSGTAIYAYNSNTYTGNAQTIGNYTIINLATLSLTGETFNIAPGQGFFVASGSGGNIEFTPSMRTTSGDDDYIEGRNSDESHFLKLDLIGSSTYSTSIFFNPNASLGLDQGYDAIVFGTNANDYPIYSHLVEDNMGLAMAIQVVEKSELVDVTIPLGINSNQGEQITFSINTSTLPITTEIYLDDTVNNVSTLLNSGDYTLTPSTDINGVGRFYLRFTNNVLSKPQNTLDNIGIYTNQSDKTVVITGQLLETTTAKIYDIQGRVVIESSLESSTRLQNINVGHISTGVYIVQLTNGKQKINQKLIIK